MATQIPLRSVRIPALQRQCLFLRRQRLDRPIVAATSRTFSSTPSSHARKDNRNFLKDSSNTREALKWQVGPSPRVDMEKVQQKEEGMLEDIGILQGTIVRAPLKELPKVRTRAFWGYFWALFKSKGMALWSRSVHRRMMQKQRLSRFLPVDAFKNEILKERAKNMYKHMYTSFAEGNLRALRDICLTPLTMQFRERIRARGNLEVTWKLHEWKSVKVVSHRSAPLGEDQPDTAYRQVIIRLESLQSITRKQIDDVATAAVKEPSYKSMRKQPAWIPEEAREKLKQAPKTDEAEKSKQLAAAEDFAHNGEIRTVVEYLVLQKRVIRGVEQDWKILGFTEETTPERLKSDDEYWSKQLAVQAQLGGV
ncbi:hypothetical protein J1614_007328 [Plenodomus biglobosus]|nr:hypothetical protein J1614_007328 [Plenodomus biglobosus]